MKNKNIELLTSQEGEPMWVTLLGCGAGFVLLLLVLAL